MIVMMTIFYDHWDLSKHENQKIFQNTQWYSSKAAITQLPSPYRATMLGSNSIALFTLLISILGIWIFLHAGHSCVYTAHHGLSVTISWYDSLHIEHV